MYNMSLGWAYERKLILSQVWIGLWCLTPLSTTIHLYRGGQLYWPQTLFEHWIAYKAIVGYTSETTVNCEAKPNCQYHLSSFVPN